MCRQVKLSRAMRLHCHRIVHLGLAGVLLLTAAAVSAQEPFFDDGKTEWKIYLSPEAGQTEVYAAQELQGALKKESCAPARKNLTTRPSRWAIETKEG